MIGHRDLAFVVLAVFSFAANGAEARPGNAPKLIFEDNFGSSDEEVRTQDIYSSGCHADSCKWTVPDARINSMGPDICLYRANVGAAPGGGLRVSAIRGNYSVPKDGGGTQQCSYSTAFLQSRKLFKYGYFEMTAKVPTVKGMLPALWLYSQGRAAEIDLIDGHGGTKFGGNIFYWRDNPSTIIQGVLDPVANTVMPTIARGGFGPSPQQHADYSTGFRLSAPARSLSDEYHTYAVNWEPSGITFFFDGQAYFSTNRTLTDPMMLTIDLEVTSRSADPSSFPQTLDVQRIRVYDHAPDNLRPPAGMPMLMVGASRQNSYDLPRNKLTAWAGPSRVPYVGPPVPENLQFTNRTSGSVDLSWQAGGESSRTYEIAYLAGATAPDCSTAKKIGNRTSFSIGGLSPGSQYTVAVCAIDMRGGQSFPQIISVRTLSSESKP